jgi:excisionase family DNA binding protein
VALVSSVDEVGRRLVGLGGPEVVVSGEVASVLVVLLRAGVERARCDGVTLSAPVNETLSALVFAAARHDELAAARGDERLASAQDAVDGSSYVGGGSSSMEWIDVVEAARRLGCGVANVRDLARRGRLRRRLVGRSVLVAAVDVDERAVGLGRAEVA